MMYSKPYTFKVESRKANERDWQIERENLTLTLTVHLCGRIKDRGQHYRAIRSDGRVFEPAH